MNLLLLINKKLEDLNSKYRFDALPKVPSLLELCNKKILLVDDSLGWIEFWLPRLLVATSGQADALHHQKNCSAQELCDKIAQLKPEYILLDYFLAAGIKGEDLIGPIKALLPEVVIFGFSSITASNKKLLQSGASAAFDKTSPDANYILAELAESIAICN